MEGGQTVWTDIVKFKVVASLFLNSYVIHPLIAMMVEEDDTEVYESTKIAIHFYIIVTLILVSIASKAYREDICNNFEKDPFHEKLDEIKSKLKFEDDIGSSDE